MDKYFDKSELSLKIKVFDFTKIFFNQRLHHYNLYNSIFICFWYHLILKYPSLIRNSASLFKAKNNLHKFSSFDYGTGPLALILLNQHFFFLFFFQNHLFSKTICHVLHHSWDYQPASPFYSFPISRFFFIISIIFLLIACNIFCIISH